ncbi:hypothetical protein V1509DRAFT_667178 [Lipomyces kononenkoae]
MIVSSKYFDTSPSASVAASAVGTPNVGGLSLIEPPQLPAVGGDLALQNEIFITNIQMDAVRQCMLFVQTGLPRPSSRFSVGSLTLTEQLQEWCDERQFVDGQLATESKLIAFLQTELIEKVSRNRQLPYSMSTLKLHVAAVTDLWKQQVDFGLNPHPTPSPKDVRFRLKFEAN